MESATTSAAKLCNHCGDCFVRCPYMELSREEAISEIKLLIAGEPTRHVMRKCISCNSCDVFCKQGARPYQMILERWSARYDAKGLPARASYMLPYQTPNYREDIVPEMNPHEKDLLAKWKNARAEGEMLFPGCNLLTAPSLFDLRALDILPVAGDWSLCCGEPYYRLGAFDAVSLIAKKLTEYYSDKKISKMIFLCPACMNMFRNVLPERFGAKFDFECEYFVTWLLRKLDEGAIEIKKPLQRKITIHDSCHGRNLGDEIMLQTRELYSRLGLEIVEMENGREEGICCGIAAGCNRQMPHDIVIVGSTALREAAATGAKETAIYCTGCYLHLGMIDHIARSGQTLSHTLEFVAEALGETTPRFLEKRTGKMLYNIVRKPLFKLLSLKRFKLKSVS